MLIGNCRLLGKFGNYRSVFYEENFLKDSIQLKPDAMIKVKDFLENDGLLICKGIIAYKNLGLQVYVCIEQEYSLSTSIYVFHDYHGILLHNDDFKKALIELLYQYGKFNSPDYYDLVLGLEWQQKPNQTVFSRVLKNGKDYSVQFLEECGSSCLHPMAGYDSLGLS